jgi:antitoxin (DNA-binding transcriptional repressor) of toxin-antitoxin stability system
MKTYTISQAKAKLGEIVRAAAQGESVGIISGANVVSLKAVPITPEIGEYDIMSLLENLADTPPSPLKGREGVPPGIACGSDPTFPGKLIHQIPNGDRYFVEYDKKKDQFRRLGKVPAKESVAAG